MSKLGRGGVNLGDDTLRAPAEMHRFATAIVWRTSAFDPAFVLETMQQSDERRLFNAKPRGDFRLSQRFRRNR